MTEKGSQYYGKGAPYAVFAGRDGSRALTLGSLDPKDVERRDVSDFSEGMTKAFKEQHKFYTEKYGPRVGRLVD